MISYVYQLPFGHGRSFGAGWHPVMDAVAGGWQVNGITRLQSGLPLQISASNTAGIFNAVTRPNNSGKGAIDDPSMGRWFNTQVFSQPAAFTLGNYARMSPDIRSDFSQDWDLSVFKEFPIRALSEEARVQVRAEFFNAFNQVVFAAPNTVVTSLLVGTVSSQGNSPRNIQLALKVYF